MKPIPAHAKTVAAPLRFRAKNVAAAPAVIPRMGIIGSARNRDRRKSTAYCSRGIRRQRFVRSTAKIKIPPDHSPQKTNMIQALICVPVMLYSFLYYPLDTVASDCKLRVSRQVSAQPYPEFNSRF